MELSIQTAFKSPDTPIKQRRPELQTQTCPNVLVSYHISHKQVGTLSHYSLSLSAKKGHCEHPLDSSTNNLGVPA